MNRTVLFVQETNGQNWHVIDVQNTQGPTAGVWWLGLCGVGAGNAPFRLRAGTLDEDGRGSFPSFPAVNVPLDVCPSCAEKA